MVTTHFTHASILALNAVLVESPSSLAEHFTAETPSLICQGISHKDVSSDQVPVKKKMTKANTYDRFSYLIIASSPQASTF